MSKQGKLFVLKAKSYIFLFNYMNFIQLQLTFGYYSLHSIHHHSPFIIIHYKKPGYRNIYYRKYRSEERRVGKEC